MVSCLVEIGHKNYKGILPQIGLTHGYPRMDNLIKLGLTKKSLWNTLN